MNYNLHSNYPYFFLESKNPVSFPIPEGYTFKKYTSSKDIDTLHFPSDISEEIGLSINEITHLKKRGCPFHGSKTTIRWVRLFLAKCAGLNDSLHLFYHQDSISNKYHEPTMNYD
jgi:hypothetical protein